MNFNKEHKIDFLVNRGFDKKKLLRLSDDNFDVIYDIAVRKEREAHVLSKEAD